MASDLADAYKATHYLVNEPQVTVMVAIGLSSLALDRLLDRHDASSGIFITAWNPSSLPRDRTRNVEASRELTTVLQRHGHRFLPAINLAANPEWTEESFFVLDLSVEEAMMLARAYSQNAIVLAEKAKAARLLWVDLAGAQKTTPTE